MPTYEYACPCCGETTDEFRAVSRRDDAFFCGHCQQVSEEKDAAGRLLARTFLAVQPGQFMVPEHFGTTLPVTGMKTNDGKSGDWENLAADFRRWDSGCSGLRDPQDNAKRRQRKGLKGTQTFAMGGKK